MYLLDSYDAFNTPIFAAVVVEPPTMVPVVETTLDASPIVDAVVYAAVPRPNPNDVVVAAIVEPITGIVATAAVDAVAAEVAIPANIPNSNISLPLSIIYFYYRQMNNF